MIRPFRLGLTGSVGMGKSTTAGLFAEAGVPVWDADAAVHRLYSTGGNAVAAIAGLCPDAVRDGAVDRDRLKGWIARDPGALAAIESVVHPLVTADRDAFIAAHSLGFTPLVVLDMPLLFETGADRSLDATLVVTAPPEVQRARVLSRPGMTGEQFDLILARQMPDADKRARADHVIETMTLETTRAAVQDLIGRLKGA